MENNKNKNNYLISCISCILVLMLICYFGVNNMIKGTRAAFGNGCITACMDANMLVTYHPNYPDDLEEPESKELQTCAPHIIFRNLFTIPIGYNFVGWNTEADGSGTIYNENMCTILSSNLILYAQWEKKVINYGDLNNDKNIDNDDYLLLENHLNTTSLLDNELLLNADVNWDYNVDEIDLDIIKQVILKRDGYIGYLPEKIVPIYELYKEEIIEDDKESNDSDNDESTMSPGSNGPVSGNGSGNGGTGTGSSGTGNSSLGNGGNNNIPNYNTGNSNGTGSNNTEIKQEDVIFDAKIYNFKFIVGNSEYANTSCDTGIYSSSCKLVLPSEAPVMSGYTFNGWSMNKDCPLNSIINYSILMEQDATYYACFSKEKNNGFYSTIIIVLLVFLIWIFAIFGIIFLIKRFKKSEIKD